MVSRRQWLSLTALGAIPVAAYPTVLEPRWLELTHTDVPLGLRTARPIRILHLSDFHASRVVPMSLIEQAIAVGLQQHPDFVCLTGDFITWQIDFDVDAYLGILRKLAKQVPTYAVLGNHDGGAWAPARGGFAQHHFVEELLRQSGVKLLHNQSETIQVKGSRLSLVGVGDYWSQEMDPETAFARADPDIPAVLLSHNPDSKQALGGHAWNLMLSGHTHGGQVLVPFKGPCFAPVEDKALYLA